MNITINQYAESKPMEEEKLSKMIHESIKSIAKIIESSSKTKKRKIRKKPRDLRSRPPRQKVNRIKSKNTKKNKTVSLDGNDENKETIPNLDLHIGKCSHIKFYRF